jgi:hypothetical protein
VPIPRIGHTSGSAVLTQKRQRLVAVLDRSNSRRAPKGRGCVRRIRVKPHANEERMTSPRIDVPASLGITHSHHPPWPDGQHSVPVCAGTGAGGETWGAAAAGGLVVQPGRLGGGFALFETAHQSSSDTGRNACIDRIPRAAKTHTKALLGILRAAGAQGG